MDMIPKRFFGPLAEEDPNLNYEDRILANEINRRMGKRIEDLKNKGIGVKSEYGDKHKIVQPLLPNKSSPGRWYAYTPVGAETETIKKYGDKPFVNIPRTPTLENYLTLAEEAAHAENKKSREIYPKDSPKGNMMNVYLEEMRAKDLAKKEVGGYLTPHAQYLHDAYRDSYLELPITSLLFAIDDYKKNAPLDPFEKDMMELTGRKYTGALSKDYWDNKPPIEWIKKNYPDLAKKINDNPDLVMRLTREYYDYFK